MIETSIVFYITLFCYSGHWVSFQLEGILVLNSWNDLSSHDCRTTIVKLAPGRVWLEWKQVGGFNSPTELLYQTQISVRLFQKNSGSEHVKTLFNLQTMA